MGRATSSLIWVFSGLSLAVLNSGCDSNLELRNYVDRVIELNLTPQSQDAAVGVLEFQREVKISDQEVQCEKVACGSHFQKSCERSNESVPGRWVCNPTLPLSQRCRYEAPKSDWVETNCVEKKITDYCTQNCKKVAVTKNVGSLLHSAISVRFQGIQDPNALESLELGVNTNLAFSETLAHLGQSTLELRGLLSSLQSSDKNLMLLKAKGYRLVADQDFLPLSSGFDAGDPIEITLRVEPTGSPSEVVSVIGTRVAFPPLIPVSQ